MRRLGAIACAAAGAVFASAGCGKIQGFGGPSPSLASFTVTFSGQPASPPAAPRVALVWGAQWWTEPLCLLEKELPEAAAVIRRGCRDAFGFVPLEVGASAPLAVSGTTSLELAALPPADVLVGDVSARVAYGSLVVFDDRDGDGTLTLARPHRTASGRGDERRRADEGGDPADVIYGASFVTMTEADRRVAYREGGPPTGAFYPRAGCPAPEPGFSVVDAGGFSASQAANLAPSGELPMEDPTTCFASSPGATTVDIRARASEEVEEVGCDERTEDGSTRYREPPVDAPDFTDRLTVCTQLPAFDTSGKPASSGLIQLVVTGRLGDRCKGLTHYTLRGCFEDVGCLRPDWDYTANPPAWWPCQQVTP